MRKDSILAEKSVIHKEDLLDVPLICSRQAISQERSENKFAKWFGEDFDKLDIVTTFNLVYNAAIMVETGIGYAITIDKIANTSETSSLCFRPLEPRLDSELNIVWKKIRFFLPLQKYFWKGCVRILQVNHFHLFRPSPFTQSITLLSASDTLFWKIRFRYVW